MNKKGHDTQAGSSEFAPRCKAPLRFRPNPFASKMIQPFSLHPHLVQGHRAPEPKLLLAVHRCHVRHTLVPCSSHVTAI